MVEGPIELRVHGVSGTPPEAMLNHPHVRRCAGGVLWLLLPPFTLVNVGHFMQPRELPAGDRRRRLLEAVLGLLALSLTLTLVLSVVGVAMDLAAWQCPAARATCSDRQVFLRFLGQGSGTSRDGGSPWPPWCPPPWSGCSGTSAPGPGGATSR